MDIEIAYSPGHGPQIWEPRYNRGEVPGRWLYGLNLLREPPFRSVVGTELRPLSSLGRARAVSLMLPRRLRRPDKKLDRSAWLVCWDEQAATRAFVQRRVGNIVGGAIWCLDEKDRNPRGLRTAITRRVLLGLDGIWCLNRPQVDALAGWLGSAAPPIRYIPFGIDHEFFERHPYPRSPAAPIVLSLGSDRDRDGATLVRAMLRVSEEIPSAKIMIQCSPDLKVPSHFIRLPRLSHLEIRDLYRSASVVVVPTRHNEHFSGMTVALEAMSVARPVVLSDTPGAADYVRPGTDGFLVRPGDANGFAERVIELLRDPDAAERLGDSGSAAVAARFQHRHLAQSIREFIEFLDASKEDDTTSRRAALK